VPAGSALLRGPVDAVPLHAVSPERLAHLLAVATSTPALTTVQVVPFSVELRVARLCMPLL